MKEVYNFSEKVLKQRKQLMIIMTIAIILLIPTMEISMIGLQEVLASDILFKITAGILVFLTIEMILVSYIMLKKVKKTKLTVNEDALIRSGGKTDETIYFSEITNMKVIRNPQNEIVMIKLKLGKKPMIIWGVEGLDEIEALLEEKVVDSVNISEKKWKVDWNSPLMMIVCMIIFSSIMMIFMKHDTAIGNTVNGIFSCAFALYIIFFKPISKSNGKRFRALELICGILIIVGQLVTIASTIAFVEGFVDGFNAR